MRVLLYKHMIVMHSRARIVYHCVHIYALYHASDSTTRDGEEPPSVFSPAVRPGLQDRTNFSSPPRFSGCCCCCRLNEAQYHISRSRFFMSLDTRRWRPSGLGGGNAKIKKKGERYNPRPKRSANRNDITRQMETVCSSLRNN